MALVVGIYQHNDLKSPYPGYKRWHLKEPYPGYRY